MRSFAKRARKEKMRKTQLVMMIQPAWSSAVTALKAGAKSSISGELDIAEDRRFKADVDDPCNDGKNFLHMFL